MLLFPSREFHDDWLLSVAVWRVGLFMACARLCLVPWVHLFSVHDESLHEKFGNFFDDQYVYFSSSLACSKIYIILFHTFSLACEGFLIFLSNPLI